MKACFRSLAITSCLLSFLSFAYVEGKNKPSHAKTIIQQVFNILTQGALAVTAQDPQEQIRATANVLNSISVIAQLTVDDDDEYPTKYAGESSDHALQFLSAKLHKLCIADPEFMEELNRQSPAYANQLKTILDAHSLSAPHTEHAQTD